MNDNVSISELSLYEDDKGTESPNPANAHLLDGKFRFDSSSGRRTYRWANALCALHFLPTTDAIGTHVRFVDVITRLKQRLQRLRSLKEQADEIADGRKRMRDEKVQIAHFEKLHDMAKKELRVRVRDTALVYRVSLKAKAGADNVCGVFVVNVIEENSTPVLHMENCGGLSGRLSDIERNVNNTDGKGTLRARVEALVGCVEALVVDAESSSRSRDTRRKVHDRERVADYSDV